MTAQSPELTLEPLAYRIPEVAHLLAVSKRTVYELIKDGSLPSIKIRRDRRVTRAQLDQYLQERSTA